MPRPTCHGWLADPVAMTSPAVPSSSGRSSSPATRWVDGYRLFREWFRPSRELPGSRSTSRMLRRQHPQRAESAFKALARALGAVENRRPPPEGHDPEHQRYVSSRSHVRPSRRSTTHRGGSIVGWRARSAQAPFMTLYPYSTAARARLPKWCRTGSRGFAALLPPSMRWCTGVACRWVLWLALVVVIAVLGVVFGPDVRVPGSTFPCGPDRLRGPGAASPRPATAGLPLPQRMIAACRIWRR